MKQSLVHHLFRHQYAKMVAILTRIFGLKHLETIEDAIHDTFLKISISWRNHNPENPEAQLLAAAKNRTIDLLRKIKAEDARLLKMNTGAASLQLNEMFLEHEIEDSQLRMIFVACHPELKPQEQIVFALKTLSGFSQSEISAALLTKEETVKKRLARARKIIRDKNIQFKIPQGDQLKNRMARVMEVIYLAFNEGFHSTNKHRLIRDELCGEAMRLCQILLKKKNLRSSELYALFALMCLHASRLKSKVNEQGELINIRKQDRSLWYKPMIELGSTAYEKSFQGLDSKEEMTSYQLEATIAMEHVKSSSFQSTNWKALLNWYFLLNQQRPSSFNLLNIAVIQVETNDLPSAIETLGKIKPESLAQREYLYHGCMAEYFFKKKEYHNAVNSIERSIELTSNEAEKEYLNERRIAMLKS